MEFGYHRDAIAVNVGRRPSVEMIQSNPLGGVPTSPFLEGQENTVDLSLLPPSCTETENVPPPAPFLAGSSRLAAGASGNAAMLRGFPSSRKGRKPLHRRSGVDTVSPTAHSTSASSRNHRPRPRKTACYPLPSAGNTLQRRNHKNVAMLCKTSRKRLRGRRLSAQDGTKTSHSPDRADTEKGHGLWVTTLSVPYKHGKENGGRTGGVPVGWRESHRMQATTMKGCRRHTMRMQRRRTRKCLAPVSLVDTTSSPYRLPPPVLSTRVAPWMIQSVWQELPEGHVVGDTATVGTTKQPSPGGTVATERNVDHISFSTTTTTPFALPQMTELLVTTTTMTTKEEEASGMEQASTERNSSDLGMRHHDTNPSPHARLDVVGEASFHQSRCFLVHASETRMEPPCDPPLLEDPWGATRTSLFSSPPPMSIPTTTSTTVEQETQTLVEKVLLALDLRRPGAISCLLPGHTRSRSGSRAGKGGHTTTGEERRKTRWERWTSEVLTSLSCSWKTPKRRPPPPLPRESPEVESERRQKGVQRPLAVQSNTTSGWQCSKHRRRRGKKGRPSAAFFAAEESSGKQEQNAKEDEQKEKTVAPMETMVTEATIASNAKEAPCPTTATECSEERWLPGATEDHPMGTTTMSITFPSPTRTSITHSVEDGNQNGAVAPSETCWEISESSTETGLTLPSSWNGGSNHWTLQDSVRTSTSNPSTVTSIFHEEEREEKEDEGWNGSTACKLPVSEHQRGEATKTKEVEDRMNSGGGAAGSDTRVSSSLPFSSLADFGSIVLPLWASDMESYSNTTSLFSPSSSLGSPWLSCTASTCTCAAILERPTDPTYRMQETRRGEREEGDVTQDGNRRPCPLAPPPTKRRQDPAPSHLPSPLQKEEKMMEGKKKTKEQEEQKEREGEKASALTWTVTQPCAASLLHSREASPHRSTPLSMGATASSTPHPTSMGTPLLPLFPLLPPSLVLSCASSATSVTTSSSSSRRKKPILKEEEEEDYDGSKKKEGRVPLGNSRMHAKKRKGEKRGPQRCLSVFSLLRTGAQAPPPPPLAGFFPVENSPKGDDLPSPLSMALA